MKGVTWFVYMMVAFNNKERTRAMMASGYRIVVVHGLKCLK